MARITQDIRFRLFLIKYDEKFSVTKSVVKYKPADSTFIVRNAAMTAPGTPLGTAPGVPITIPTSIPLTRQS